VQLFNQNPYAAWSVMSGGIALLFAFAQAGLFALGFSIVAVCTGSYGVEQVRRQRADADDPDSVPPTQRVAAAGFGLGLLALCVYAVLVSFF